MPGLYNQRVQAIFDEIKSYVGFGRDDEAILHACAPLLRPIYGRVVERFYAEIERQPRAYRVLADAGQAERLRASLHRWLERLFTGPFDGEYVELRSRIGHEHVRVGLPQHYMFAAMEIVWQELSQAIQDLLGHQEAPRALEALHKLITIETGIMLESYRASYAERIRKLEHDAVRERLSRAEELAEVGQLAASLAHEIKNPLAGISGAIQVLRDDLERDDTRRRVLDDVLRQVSRLDGTVKDLLTYARPRPAIIKECRLASVIERVTALLVQEPAMRDVRLEVPDCSDLAPIEADDHQLEQLLINLLLNAAQASSSGAVVQLQVSAEDDEVTISVRDEGHGMKGEAARRAFEPFFTTKARGTGLGLPICRRIVEAHNGEIHVRSNAKRGTLVEIRLPRAQSAVRSGR